MATTHTTTTALRLLPEKWAPGMLMESTEEKVVTKQFSRPVGTRKINQKLHIPKVKRIAATGGSTYGTGLTYTANTEEEVTISPIQAYAAVELTRSVYLRMDTSPESIYRKMILKGLAEFEDYYGAQLATGLTTNIKGSALANLDKGLAADVLQALTTTCRGEFVPGQTPWYLKLHNTQVKNLVLITDFTADYARGDSEKPNVSGWVSKALGAIIEQSGNIYVAAGIAHNLAYIEPAFVVGYNEEPTMLDAQPVELVTRLIGTEEFGMSEAFDEYACDMQTAA